MKEGSLFIAWLQIFDFLFFIFLFSLEKLVIIIMMMMMMMMVVVVVAAAYDSTILLHYICNSIHVCLFNNSNIFCFNSQNSNIFNVIMVHLVLIDIRIQPPLFWMVSFEWFYYYSNKKTQRFTIPISQSTVKYICSHIKIIHSDQSNK